MCPLDDDSKSALMKMNEEREKEKYRLMAKIIYSVCTHPDNFIAEKKSDDSGKLIVKEDSQFLGVTEEERQKFFKKRLLVPTLQLIYNHLSRAGGCGKFVAEGCEYSEIRLSAGGVAKRKESLAKMLKSPVYALDNGRAIHDYFPNVEAKAAAPSLDASLANKTASSNHQKGR